MAKGLGMLLVILGHLLPDGSYLRHFIYSFHMPLFYILAGFVLKYDEKRRGCIELLQSEIKLIVIYCFWSIIYLIYDLGINMGILRTMSFRGFTEHTFLTISTYGINVLWFIGSLIVGKIITKLILSLIKAESQRWLVVLTLIVLPAAFSSVLVRVKSWLLSVVLVIALRGLFVSGLILIGYLTKDRAKELVGKKKVVYGSLLLLVNFFVCIYIGRVDVHSMKLGVWPLFLITMITGTAGFLCLCIFLEKIQIFQKPMIFIGTNSLFIMVTHNYFYINEGVTFVAKGLTDNEFEKIAISFIGLVIIEILLCQLVAPIINNIVNGVLGVIKQIEYQKL